jgi:hypothetical protein
MLESSKFLRIPAQILTSTCYRQAITVEKEIPLEVDAGYLTVTDPNPIDEESYK